MIDQLDILYGYVTGVASSCAENLHAEDSIVRGFPKARTADAAERVKLEMHLFGTFLASRALLNGNHDRTAWEKFCHRCADRMLKSFGHLPVEGNDFEDFIAT